MNRKISIANLVFAFILMVLVVVLNSCSSLIPEPQKKTANEYIYEKFQDWYLWYDQIPDIDPNGIESQQDLIDSIKSPVDRWSFSGSLTEINKLLEGGEYTGYGGGLILDADSKMKITFVYKDSPFGKAGVERGWELVSVNGYTSHDLVNVNNTLSSTEPVVFDFIDLNHSNHSFKLKKEAITKNTVLYSTIIDYGTPKIGYFVFDSFLGTSAAELDTVFTRFKNANVTELIVDLRYNGGGLNNIANQLIAEVGGLKVKDQVVSELAHNDRHTDKNSTEKADFKGVSLNLNRVFFITTNQTASASELVINCLTPFMEVNLTGSNTHGKPVGMYVFSVKALDLAILPICFKITNKDGYGDYYNGLPVNTNEADDLSHAWGDPEEAMLKSVLNSIVNPALAQTQPTLKSMRASLQRPLEYKGIYQIIRAY
jgi:carboxyl-terminal processing protease